MKHYLLFLPFVWFFLLGCEKEDDPIPDHSHESAKVEYSNCFSMSFSYSEILDEWSIREHREMTPEEAVSKYISRVVIDSVETSDYSYQYFEDSYTQDYEEKWLEGNPYDLVVFHLEVCAQYKELLEIHLSSESDQYESYSTDRGVIYYKDGWRYSK